MANNKGGCLKYFFYGFGILLVLSFFMPNNKKDKQNESTLSKSTTTTSNSCDFRKVDISMYEVGTDKLIENKTVNGCFTKKIIDKALGLVEITDGVIKVTYYIEKTPNNLRFLNLYVAGGEPSRWRANEGHDIFMNDNNGNLHFIFGDRKVSKTKGTIIFSK